MSASTFQCLLDEFRRGWIETDSKLFNLSIRLPGGMTVGLDALREKYPERFLDAPEGPLDRPPFDSSTQELIAKVSLPFTRDPVEGFTNFAGYAVINKDQRIAPLIETFKRLCSEAGAALPAVIRERLAGYCPWECREPASWWIALLAYYNGITAYNSLGNYQEEHLVGNQQSINPWHMSVELIERLRLNTESPRWPAPVDAQPAKPAESEQHLPDASDAENPPDTLEATDRANKLKSLQPAEREDHLDELAATIRPLDDSEDWISNKAAAKLLSVKTETLANRRTKGAKREMDGGVFGQHDGYCFWRKHGNQHPSYYLPRMKEHAGQLVKFYPSANLKRL